MTGAFLLYRGTQMQEDWTYKYRDKIGNQIRLNGNTSCSRKLIVALGFALDNLKLYHTPVLFVTACQNFYAPKGIMMNNDHYSAYPEENELLLQEGCKVWVLHIDENVFVDDLESAHLEPPFGFIITIFETMRIHADVHDRLYVSYFFVFLRHVNM